MSNIGVRIHPELRAAIERAAAEDRRPIAQWVRIVLENALERRDEPAQHRQGRAR